MSTSASAGLAPYTAIDMMEEALTRAGIKQEQITPEMVDKSLVQLNLIFTNLLNRGVQLWKRQQFILPCYLNTANVPLPAGINLVDKLVRRGLTRQTGTPFSSAGGTAANAFDGDLSTYCEQTSANGSIGCVLASATQVTNIGVLFTAAMDLAFFVEYSLDGVTNWTALDAWSGSVTDGEWVWVDLDGAPQALGWRIRSISTLPFIATEIFFGINPSEIPLDPWNLDEYNSMPNKVAGGRVVNYYQQRDLNTVVLKVWPVPDTTAIFDTLVVWCRQYLDTVTEPTQALDLPVRWNDAMTSELARRLCRSLPEADLKRYDLLKNEENEAIALAEGEERDYSNSNIDMGLGAYTA